MQQTSCKICDIVSVVSTATIDVGSCVTKYFFSAAMFMPLSIVYQPLVGWLIMTMDWKYTLFGFVYRPWRLYMALSSLINAFAYCVFLCLPESPKFMLGIGQPQEALNILVIGYKANGGKDVSHSALSIYKFVDILTLFKEISSDPNFPRISGLEFSGYL